jgi:hypothetical protein
MEFFLNYFFKLFSWATEKCVHHNDVLGTYLFWLKQLPFITDNIN